MNLRKYPVIQFVAFLFLLTGANAQHNSGHWVATWGTAQQLLQTGPTQPRPPQNPAPPINLAVPTAVSAISNQTVRMIVRASIGGDKIRLRFANAYGNKPVTFKAVHVALHTSEGAILPASDRVVRFDGKEVCTIGAGVVMYSDLINLTVKPLSELAVSLYIADENIVPTTHLFGLHTAYHSSTGDFSAAEKLNDATTSLSLYWLAGVDVWASATSATIVTLGDSITDGHGSMPDKNHNWPSYFSERMQGDKRTARFGIVNAGISGNQLLRDGGGVLGGMSALARLDRDVLVQPGLQWVMLMEGINDISSRTRTTAEPVDAEAVAGAVISGYKQIIEHVHSAGLKIIGCTLTPFGGSRAFTDKGEAARQAVNKWIRTSSSFDAIVDFDLATRDEAQPVRLREQFHAGDWLHPGDAGYEAMARAIPLELFVQAGKSKGKARTK